MHKQGIRYNQGSTTELESTIGTMTTKKMKALTILVGTFLILHPIYLVREEPTVTMMPQDPVQLSTAKSIPVLATIPSDINSFVSCVNCEDKKT